jgi:hypothetical protein
MWRTSKAVKDSHKLRITRWDMFRKHIGIRSRMQFLYHLSARGYAGKLVFAHEKQKLEVQVSVGRAVDSSHRGGS